MLERAAELGYPVTWCPNAPDPRRAAAEHRELDLDAPSRLSPGGRHASAVMSARFQVPERLGVRESS
ncbi:hypothetical protein GCM10020229_50250 [Kitasatospora albolonga]